MDKTQARTLGSSLAQVVEELELAQPVVVTKPDLQSILADRQIKTPASEVARRLRERGWLLPTGQRGVWEFAPGAHAGPYGHGDPLLALRALLAVDTLPGTQPAACLHSALWLHGLADRAPQPHEVALPPRAHVPASLRRSFRVVRFDAALAPELHDGLPTHRIASVLVHLASRPSDVHSWAIVGEALPDAVERVDVDSLRTELAHATNATKSRLGYLLKGQDTAHLSLADLGVRPAEHPVWFGPRSSPGRFDREWNVTDTAFHKPPRTTS